jgi:hypothetical protein
MLTKFMVLLVAGSALTGCCVSGTGCATTQTAGAPIAWDGLGEPPTAANDAPGEQKRPAKRRAAARDREIILGPLNGAPAAQSEAKARYDDWTRQPNEDAEADARLARQTKICKGC